MPQLENGCFFIKKMNRRSIGAVEVIAVCAQDHGFKLIFRELIKERLNDAKCAAAIITFSEIYYIVKRKLRKTFRNIQSAVRRKTMGYCP